MAAVAWLALLPPLTGCTPHREDRPARQAAASPPARAQQRNTLVLEGVSVIQSPDAAGSASLSARKLAHRLRSGAAGFITYQNLAELVVVDAELDMQLSEWSGFSSILDRMGNLFSTDQVWDSLDSRAVPIVTRVLFEDLSVRVEWEELELSLRADRASLLLDSDTLVLESGVAMLAPDHQEVRARRAVLAGEHDGMYLPLGHTRSGARFEQSSFLLLDRRGRLSATPGTPGIAYEDLIEKRERLVLEHYAKRAPAALRPVLLAILVRLHRPERVVRWRRVEPGGF